MSIANHALPTYKLDMKKCHDWITHNSIIIYDLGIWIELIKNMNECKPPLAGNAIKWGFSSPIQVWPH